MYWIDSIVHILLYKHHHFCPRRVPSRRECLETTQKYLHIKSKHWFVCLCTIPQTCEWAQFSDIVLKLRAQSWRHYQYIQAHRLVELRVCIPEYWMIHLFDVSRKLFRPLWWEVPNIVCRRLPNLSNIKNSFKILKAFYNKRWCKIRGGFFSSPASSPPQLLKILAKTPWGPQKIFKEILPKKERQISIISYLRINTQFAIREIPSPITIFYGASPKR